MTTKSENLEMDSQTISCGPSEMPLEEIEVRAIEKFKGQFETLESALGMLRIGGRFGWKVLVLVHNKRTIQKYEKILGIKVREQFPEIGPYAHKSVGFKAAQKLGNFWKVVSGDLKVPGKRDVD